MSKEQSANDANAAINDQTLIHGAQDPNYMYSVNDVHNIAIALRQRYLNYDDLPAVNLGEEYASLRANSNQILLLEPYALQNLREGIEEDIQKIIQGGQGVAAWERPPLTILIPFLTAAHWISIKIDINYEERSASLLWDNPYGTSYETGEYEVGQEQITSLDIINYVKNEVEKLIENYHDKKHEESEKFVLSSAPLVRKDINWVLNYQQMDQQGLGIDGVSCGTVTLQNIEDYLDARVNHGLSVPEEYTIPSYKDNLFLNRVKLQEAKKEHVKMYLEITGEEIDLGEEDVLGSENDSLFLEGKDKEKLEREVSELEKDLFSKWDLQKESRLPDIEEEKHKALVGIQEAHARMLQHFAQGDRREEEKEIVKILKPVLSKPEARSLYVDVKDVATETLSALYNLGQIYLQDANYYNNHVKAAAIFQYCARFSDEYKVAIKLSNSVAGDGEYFIKQAYLVERNFLASRGRKVEEVPDYIKDSADKLGLYKNELVAIREYTKQKLEDIESLGIDQIGIRTTKVRDIYQDCTSFFVCAKKEQLEGKKEEVWQRGLVQRLIAESIERLGAPPEGCEYSIIGLGSLAFGTMTPWSDLEFAVLIKDEAGKKREDEYREYFRNLTKLLWIKVINLGETPLSSVGVEALNDYKTGKPEDNWFEDNITEKAFRFDPVYEDACKSALGRQGDYIVKKTFENKDGIEETKTLKKPNYELIKAPQEMMEFQDRVLRELPEEDSKEKADSGIADSWFYTEKHLVQTLQTPILISGSKDLLGEYRRELKQFREKNLELVQERALQILQEDTKKFKLKLGDEEEGKLLDAKQTIYRLGDRIINALANYYGISAEDGEAALTVWQIIDRMEEGKLLSPEGAQHLREAISIGTGLRLSTYSHNEGRFDTLSAYQPVVTDNMSEEQKKALVHKTFHVQDTSVLHHFYYVMLVLQYIIQESFNKNISLFLILEKMDLYATDNYSKGMVHARLLEYDSAVKYMKAAKIEQSEDTHYLKNLTLLYNKVGLINDAFDAARSLCGLNKKNYKDYSNIAQGLTNLGNIYGEKGEYDKAIQCYIEALSMWSKESIINISYASVGNCYNNLGVANCAMGEYNKAISFYCEALKIRQQLYKSDPNHPSIAHCYNNLSIVYNEKGAYRKAITYQKIALQIMEKAYALSPNHPDILGAYNNLGLIHNSVGEYSKATYYFHIVLATWQKVYELNPNHPDIALSYNNLGLAYNNKGEFLLAAFYYDKALKIKLITYALSPNHPEIARGYANLGSVYDDMGEYDQAITYYNLALEIRKIAYQFKPNHPEIADIYNNLGLVYNNKGDFDQAIAYFKKALEIRGQVYSSDMNHPDIAGSYNNLGLAYNDQGDFDQAIFYYDRALKIWEVSYVSSPNHPSIANCYNNLGNVYKEKGAYNKAIFYYDISLKMFGKIYELCPNHPDIARNYNNLGLAHCNIEEYSKGFFYYNKALNMFDIVYASSPNHPDIGNCYNNLGLAYCDIGNYDQAITYYNIALKIWRKAFKSTPNHPNISMLYNNLGLVYNNKGDFDQAIAYYNLALEITEQDDRTDCYNNLCIVYIKKEAYDKASQYVSEEVSKDLYFLVFVLLGSKALLDGFAAKAKEYYIILDPIYTKSKKEIAIIG